MKKALVEEWVEDVKIQRTGCKQEVYKKVSRFQTQVEAQVWTLFG